MNTKFKMGVVKFAQRLKELSKKYVMKNIVFTVGGLLSCLLILVFFFGNIIAIPFGTTKGAIICGIGVFVILITVTALSVGVSLLIYHYQRRKRSI